MCYYPSRPRESAVYCYHNQIAIGLLVLGIIAFDQSEHVYSVSVKDTRVQRFLGKQKLTICGYFTVNYSYLVVKFLSIRPSK